MLGIARRAEPLDHLQSRHGDFQRRMMTNAAIPTPVPTTGGPSRTDRSVLAISALAGTATTSTSSRRTASRTDPFSAPAPSTPTLTSNARLQIFVDPTGSESQAAEGNSYPDLGTRKTRVKENVPEVKKLAGTTLKQAGRSKRVASTSSGAGASRTASTSKIVPYRDPGPEEMPPPTVSASKKVREAIPKTPGKSTFVPFVENDDGGAAKGGVPETPTFTPFRDEVSSLPIVLPLQSTEVVMR